MIRVKIESFIKCINIQAIVALISETRICEWSHLGRVLIICPHPDDEILGLGGVTLKLIEKGCQIHIIFFTDGEASGVWNDRDEIGRQRILLSGKVIKNLGIATSDIYRLHLPDGDVPHPGQSGFEEAVKNVKEIIDIVKPDAVFATHPLDYWPFDHVACAHIARKAVKLSETKSQLWYYWVWAWYNIRPWQMLKRKFWRFQKIDIRDQMPKKRVLMDIYLKSLTPDGKPWSGILPPPLLKAFKFPYEIVERII